MEYFDKAAGMVMKINCLAGLRIFEYPKGRPRPIISFFYLPLLWSSFGGSVYFEQLANERSENFFTLERMLYVSILYANFAAIVILTALGCTYSKMLASCKKKILKVDESLQKLGSTLDYRNLLIKTIIAIVLWSLQCVFVYVINVFPLMEFFEESVSVYIASNNTYGASIGTIVFCDFIIFVCWIKSRYKKLNDLLKAVAVNGFQIEEKKLKPSLRPAFQVRSNTWMESNQIYTPPRILLPEYFSDRKGRFKDDNKKHTLQVIRLIHLELFKASKMACKIFNVQIALIIRVGQMYITITLYYFYLALTTRHEPILKAVEVAIIPVTECIACSIKAFIVGYVCEDAATEVKKTAELIHACSGFESDAETKDEIRQFALQMSHTQNILIKCGFFRLNYSYIGECISSIATYLVIMIQMSQSFEEEVLSTASNNSTKNLRP